MKNSIKKVNFLSIFLSLSFLTVLTGCGSIDSIPLPEEKSAVEVEQSSPQTSTLTESDSVNVPSVSNSTEEKSDTATEAQEEQAETLDSAEKTDINIEKTKEINEVFTDNSEKIDSDDILGTVAAEDDSEEPFVEPVVLDSPVEETEEPVITVEDTQIIENTATDTNVDNSLSNTTETILNNGDQNKKTTDTYINNEQEIQTSAINKEDVIEVSNKEEHQNIVELNETSEEKENQKNVKPSRSMTVKNNQFVDVVYPGNGWIYIGENQSDIKFRYFGRKLGSADTTFTLRSIKPGKTVLHFYKNDVLTGQYIDDYLEVEVINEAAKVSEKATAPSYAEVVPPKPVRKPSEQKTSETEKNPRQNYEPKYVRRPAPANTDQAAQKSSSESPASKFEATGNNDDKSVKTIIQTTDPAESDNSSASVKANDTPVFIPSQRTQTSAPSSEQKNNIETVSEINKDPSKSLLEQAKDSLNKKEYELALAQIQSYLDTESTKIDEALFIQGQILEAESPVKNLVNAMDSYDTIIKKYPSSKFCQQANKRKIFLNRFYINIY